MKSRSILLTAIILCLLMLTCGEDNPSAPDTDPPDNPDLVSEDIGPAGGTLTSSDDKLTLTIPEGALSGSETITIEAIESDVLGSEFDVLAEDIGIENAWELGPDGLEFDIPVTIQYQSEQSPDVADDTLGIFAEFLFTSNNGIAEALDSLRLEVNIDDGTTTFSGQLSHFTPLVSLQENNGVSFRILNVPEMLEAGDKFEADAFIARSTAGPLAELVTLNGPSTYTDRSSSPIEPDFTPLSMEMNRNENNHFEGSFLYGCNSTGLGVFGADLGVSVTFDLDSGPVTAESYAAFYTTIECVEAASEKYTLTINKEGAGNGTVVSDPAGIDCGVDCESDNADFEDGVGAILAATAADGSVFDGWSGDVPGTCENSTDPCTVIMDQNKSVTAAFSPAEDSAPSINRFGGEITGPRSIRLELRVEYDQELSNLGASIDPDDGSGPQEVQLEETNAENEYQGYLDWEYVEGTMFPVMPEANVTETETGESNQKTIELRKVTITVEKAGDGDGTITGTAFQGEILNCPPGCDTDIAEAIAVGFGGSVASIQLSAEADANSEFTGWSGDLLGSEGCEGTGNCTVLLNEDRTVTAQFTRDSQGDNRLKPGLVELFTFVLFNPESPFYLGDINTDSSGKYIGSSSNKAVQSDVQFGDITGTYPVAISGSEGFIVIDLLTEEVLMDETGFSNTGPFFGVAGVTQAPPGESSSAVMEAFGQNGSVFTRFDMFGALPGTSTTFDVFPAGGDVVSNVMTIVRPQREISFWVFDSNQGIYVPAESGAEFDDGLFEGELVSAYMHSDVLSDNVVPQPRGSFLVLTRGTESKLYLASWDPKEVTEVESNIGLDARKVRCIEDGSGTGNLVCAISVFGDDRLAILTWDGETMPSLTGFADVGDGPVGIDLRLLANGNVAIVSTGFNDNTVTETEVSPTGNVLSNNTRNTLDGCVNPGHAIYIEDSESLKVVGTCYTSDAYFIMESEL